MNVKVFNSMSVVNERRVFFRHESCECRCGLNEITNLGGSVNNQRIGVLAKMIIFGILVHVIASVIKHVKLTNIYILKTVHLKNVSLLS